MTELMDPSFYEKIKEILKTARSQVYASVNSAMVEAYWLIGKSIVAEQGGEHRAEYGSALLEELSAVWQYDGYVIRELYSSSARDPVAAAISAR